MNIPKKIDDSVPFDPGFAPAGHRVLVYPIPVERVTGGGIIIADMLADREEMSQVEARVIKLGGNAWKDQPEPWAKEGQKVLIGKFSGMVRQGKDGRTYRLINDLDVVGTVEE